jgi:hypothetical protein
MTEAPSVASALADLATEAGTQPLAMAGIEERARRARLRRGIGRAVTVAVCCAGLVAGIAVAGEGGPPHSQVYALTPVPVVLARCVTISAGADSATTGKEVIDHSSTATKTTADVTDSADVPEIGGVFKAPGTVTGVATEDAVTILVAAPLYPAPRAVVFAITAQTKFQSGGAPTRASILRDGNHVGFVAIRTGPESFRIEIIEINPDAARSASGRQSKTIDGPSGATGAKARDGSGPPPVGGTVEGKGTVAAIAPSVISLAVKGGSMAGETLSLTVTPATQFTVAGQQCDPTGLPAGTPMGFNATRTGATTYRLDRLNL